MLDRSKVARELDGLMNDLFVDLSPQYERALAVWRDIAHDELFRLKVRAADTVWALPSWHGRLDSAITIDSIQRPYTAIGVDGSQVYPDRHQGVSCFLINTGIALLRYGGTFERPVIFHGEPRVMSGDQTECSISIDFVNAVRQEFEFQAGLDAQRFLTATESALIIFDGSLIFWHLDAKDVMLRTTFLPRYDALLQRYCQEQIPMVSYISGPKSRELSNLVRLKLADFDQNAHEKYAVVDRVNDAALISGFLAPGQRTILFANRAKVTMESAETVRTYFFYLHAGAEIGRVEIPAWIAQQESLVDWIAAVIYDQCKKGHGYPVALAEAHEQAVIKGPDRDFFFHLLQKKAIEGMHRCTPSTKSVRKRGATV